MRRFPIALSFICALFFIGASVPLLPSAHAIPRQTACGVERWPVKVLADTDVASVNFDAVQETVADLVALPAPDSLPGHNRIAPVELTTYALTANLVEARAEDDGDIHLVIADPTTADTMIVELPDATDCALTTDFGLVVQMQSARDDYVATFGLPSRERFTGISGTALVVGVGFFDFLHGQTGVAPNGIELHPLLGFMLLSQPDATPPAPVPAPAPPPAAAPAAPASAHTWYTSSASNSTTYYCDDDPEWRTLSPRNLQSFPTVAALLAVYPSKHLHRPCRDGATGP
jgi:hypothetical protein